MKPCCNGIKDAMQHAGREHGAKMWAEQNATEGVDPTYQLISLNTNDVLLTESIAENYVARVT
jgi:hypothetical protein